MRIPLRTQTTAARELVAFAPARGLAAHAVAPLRAAHRDKW